MSQPMGERRRAREAARAAGDHVDPASEQPAPEPPPPPMTRRQRREAERAAGEEPGVAAADDEARRTDEARGADEDAVPARPPVLPRRQGVRQIVPDDPGRRRPRRLLVVLGGVAALALVVVAAVVVLGGSDDETPGAAPPVRPGGDRSLLVTVADAAGDLTGTALLASGPEVTSALLVPSRLLVDVPSGGRVPLRDALDTGEQAPAQAVGDALEVRVDGTWVLTTAGLAQLVDALGGVVVDVDAVVNAGDVALAPGPAQTLDGAQAAAFATALAVGEAEPLRLARFDQVLSGLLAGLPADAATVEQQVSALAGESRSTLDVADLATALAEVAGHVASGAYAATVLPVTEIATGAEEVLYGLDDAAAAPVLAGRFAGVLREGAGEAVRVLVQNGVGTPGLGEQARNLLVEDGLRYVGGGNADTLGLQATVVAIASDDPDSRDAGTRVALALGLGPEVVAVGQDDPTLADVVVVLGADFAALVSATPS